MSPNLSTPEAIENYVHPNFECCHKDWENCDAAIAYIAESVRLRQERDAWLAGGPAGRFLDVLTPEQRQRIAENERLRQAWDDIQRGPYTHAQLVRALCGAMRDRA